MMQTLPFILLRMAVYFGAALAYVLVTGTGAGIGWGIGALGDEGFRASATFFGGLTGLGGSRFARHGDLLMAPDRTGRWVWIPSLPRLCASFLAYSGPEFRTAAACAQALLVEY